MGEATIYSKLFFRQVRASPLPTAASVIKWLFAYIMTKYGNDGNDRGIGEEGMHFMREGEGGREGGR
jgi:hypothetical protein